MKKFLSAFLAVVMVLSMAATSLVTVFAAETAGAGEHEIAIPSIKHGVYGFELGVKWNPHFDIKTPDGSNVSLMRVYEANDTLTQNIFNIYWENKNGGTVAFDATQADAFALDLWLSDPAAVENAVIRIEVGSGGIGCLGTDGTYVHYDFKLKDLLGTVKAGDSSKGSWNTIKIPLSSMTKNAGTVDWAKVDWFRMFNIENISTGANGLKVAVDSIRFMKGDEKVAVMSECQPQMNGWEKNARPIVIDDAEVMGQTWEKTTIGAGGYITFRNQSLNLDISKMKYIEFDVYVSDVNVIKDTKLLFELRSGSAAEVDEFGFNEFKAPEKGWDNGWNHVKWAIADMSNTASGTFDPTNVVWFRIANHDAVEVKESFTMAIDNVRFTDDEAGECANCRVPHAIALPMPGSTVTGWNWGVNFELNSSVSVSSSVKAGEYGPTGAMYLEFSPGKANGVDASKADAFVFDFYVSDAAAFKGVQVELELCSGGACDNHEKRYLQTLGELVEGGMKDGWNTVVLPLSKMIDLDGNKIDWTNVNYFRCYNLGACKVGEKGLTLAIDNLRFTKEGKTVVTMSDVNPDMQGWEAPITLMNGEKFLGSYVEGNFKDFSIYVNYRSDKGIDVSKMKYLEFDIYLSDVSALKDVMLYLEINSSNNFDEEESGRDASIGQYNLENGWNHVKLPLSDLWDTTKGAGNPGAADLTNIKWFRLYNQGKNSAENVTFALANVRFADDEAEYDNCYDVHEIALPQYGTVPGWSWAPNTVVKAEGVSSVLSVLEANKKYAPASSGKVIEAYVPGAEGAVDASTADAFVFEFYVSDADVLKGLPVELELSSNPEGGDKNEMRYVSKPLNDVIAGGMKDGWNTVVIPFSAMASGSEHLPADSADRNIDWSKVSYFRMYFLGNIETGADGLVYGFDNMRFNKGDEKVATFTTCDVDMNGWDTEWGTTPSESNGFKSLSMTSENKKWSVVDIHYQYSTDKPFSAISTKYVEFDLFISDVDPIKNITLYFELRSSNAPVDEEELGTSKSIAAWNLVDGWNHVKVAISDLTDTAGNGKFDITGVQWFRIFTVETVDNLPEDITTTIANVRFTDDQAPECKFCNPDVEEPDVDAPVYKEEEYSFNPLAEDEKAFLHESLQGNINAPANTVRFADNENYIVYMFNLEHTVEITQMSFSGRFAGGLLLHISTDEGKTWSEIASYPNKVEGVKDLSWNLADYIKAASASGKVWIRIGDATPESGGGGQAVASGMFVFKTTYNATAEAAFRPGVDKNGNLVMSDGTNPAEDFYNPDKPGWSVGGGDNIWQVLDINGEKAVGEKITGPKEGELFTSRFFYIAPNTFDVTKWQYVEIDVYVTEADVVNGKTLFFDLGSDGNLLGAELSRFVIKAEGWKDGWNHIKVALDQFGSAIGTANLTKWDFVRIYFSGTPESQPAASYKLAEGEEFIIAVDNLKFTEPKPEKPATNHEIYEFEVDTEDEKKYLIQGSEFGAGNANISGDTERKYQGRYADVNQGWKYVYTIKNLDTLVAINWSAKFGAGMHMRVSADNQNWVEVCNWTELKDAIVRTVNVLDYLTVEQIQATGKVYFWFADATTNDGNGGKVYCEPKVKMDIEYTPLTDEELDAKEMTATEHKIPLWGANSNWNQASGGFVVDKENQVAGSGCVSVTLKNSKDTQVAQLKLATPVNAKGMDTLEFDIYMSDLAIIDLLNKNNSQFEVTSSGTCDYQEKSLLLCNLMDILKAGNIQAGEWFHVSINLSAMKTQNRDDKEPAGEFNWEAINFIRFYWTAIDSIPEGAEYVLKFDNFVLTDAAAQAAADAEAKKQEILEKNAALIEALEGLEEVYTATLTEENIAAMKAKVEAARAEYDKLTEEEKQLLVDEGYFTHLNKAEKVIKDYKAPEKPDEKPDDEKPDDEKPDDEKPDDEKPDDEKPNDEEPKKGCKSALTIGAGAMMLLAAAWVSMAARKKED